MRILFTLFLFLFSYSSQANDVQIIELPKNKSLEDLVNEEPSFKDSNVIGNEIFLEVEKRNFIQFNFKTCVIGKYL